MAQIIDRYKNIIEKELEERSRYSIANAPNVKYRLVVNADRTEFILLAIGWQDKVYRHRLVFHIGITDDKICIYADNTDVGIASTLAKAGIPKSAIILFFLPAYAREASGFAVA
jgi:hypothetical protein